jgi:putative restriction endonuclease
VRGFVAPTDPGWFEFLRVRREIDEVNFWRPKPDRFRAIGEGEVFFFKLRSPHNAIGGFGLYAGFAPLPVWRAWDVFGQANGAATLDMLRRRLGRNTRDRVAMELDRIIGCIAVTQPVFFAPDDWVRVPDDFSPSIMRGKAYDLTRGEGLRIWTECLERAAHRHHLTEWTTEAIELRRTGKPQVITPRLGQGSFRLAVLDAYDGACAVTNEHSLPVLETAHIRPWGQGGRHELPNGLPLRRDIHRLFDLGFVTVKPDLRFAVSPALRDVYANGATYYELAGRTITTPAMPDSQPSRELLEWHGDIVFRA